LLLTGDAHGKDVVTAWKKLELGTNSVKIDLLKMPHHRSVRNVTEDFLRFFVAYHYVFSANGKFENPDPARDRSSGEDAEPFELVEFSRVTITTRAPRVGRPNQSAAAFRNVPCSRS
jgi:hypothetical protein